jgi:hypothetical protein
MAMKEEDTTTPYSSASSAYTSESMGDQALQEAQSRLPGTDDQHDGGCGAAKNTREQDVETDEQLDELPSQRESNSPPS